MKRVSRSSLKAAPYNPRQIEPAARKRLEANLKKRGLVMPLVWNERTGNLVGGHQRLAILDDLEGSADYLLDVAVVDLDDAAERELNVFLNNRDSQGGWDLHKLEDLVGTPGLDPKSMGFDEMELSFLLPMVAELPAIADPKRDVATPDVAKIQEIKAKRREYKEQGAKADDAEYYFTVVFGDRAERDRFLDLLGLPKGERFLDGRRFALACGHDMESR